MKKEHTSVKSSVRSFFKPQYCQMQRLNHSCNSFLSCAAKNLYAYMNFLFKMTGTEI